MIGNVIPNIRKSSKKILLVRILLIALIILNFMFIWNNSAKISKESDKTSKKIATGVATVVVDDYETLPKPQQKKHVNIINSKIRSMAHLVEFVPLGFLFYVLAVCIFDMREKKLYRKFLTYTAIAIVLTLLVAFGDELHQLSVKGRTFQFRDILFDTSGSVLGCILALIPTYVLRKRI